jgi:hypothetical protein
VSNKRSLRNFRTRFSFYDVKLPILKHCQYCGGQTFLDVK